MFLVGLRGRCCHTHRRSLTGIAVSRRADVQDSIDNSSNRPQFVQVFVSHRV